jgi:hypothetical protein
MINTTDTDSFIGPNVDFSCGLIGSVAAGAGRLSSVILAGGYDGSAGVARWAGFPGPWGFLGSGGWWSGG